MIATRPVLLGVITLAVGCRGPIERVLDMDEDRPVVLDARACEEGDARACTNIADVLLNRGREGDAELAIELLRGACTTDARLACVRLADHVSQDEAATILDEACTAGEPLACQRLGERTREPDPARAYGLLGLACEDRLLAACLTQARMLEAGEGVSRDPDAAFVAYRDICAGGSPAGCREQARVLLDRGEDAADETTATLLAQRACSGGDAEGCLLAARTAESTEDADTFRERACALGAASACRDGGE